MPKVGDAVVMPHCSGENGSEFHVPKGGRDAVWAIPVAEVCSVSIYFEIWPLGNFRRWQAASAVDA